MKKSTGCELCKGDGGEVLFRDARLRIVRVEGNEGEMFVGFCRVIWNDHITELTDLSIDERNRFMAAVYQLEGALRTSLKPDKMNVASLGNLTPHLHWHVVPRFRGDVAFPKPIWAYTLNNPASLIAKPAISTDWIDAVRRAFSTNRTS